MRFSDQWLRDYAETALPPSEIGDRLTRVGIPLDSLEPAAQDTVYHFDVTTNRPDCMNHLGLARELCAAQGGRLKQPPTHVPDASLDAAPPGATVTIEAPDLCHRYSAVVLREVKVGPSPSWLAGRLQTIGLRPINSVVDATNYVLWEMGHPLHAFDLKRLSGGAIRVRRARQGERLTTLDGLERKLSQEMLVIADEAKAVAVAGVMGGKDSEISSTTREILLESAYFLPASVRKTSKSLGLHTDASHRFERGADVEITRKAARRCAALIAALTGGKVAKEDLDERPVLAAPREIHLHPDRVCRLLGLEIPESAMREILARLECRIESDGPRSWCVFPPSFRGDLSLEEDLVEEIARHYGYDKIPASLPRIFVHPEGFSEESRMLDSVRLAFRQSGFNEALNLSLLAEAENRPFSKDAGGLGILNPLVEGADRLRISLVPGLLRNLVHNLNHQATEVRLFETGRGFHAAAAPGVLPEEEELLGAVHAGRSSRRHWSEPERGSDLFDLKGAVDLAVSRLALPAPRWTPVNHPFLAEGRGASIVVSEASIGWAGELSPPILEAWKIETTAFAAELSLTRLFSLAAQAGGFRYSPVSRTPSVSRDLALVLDHRHSYREVESVIRHVGGIPVTSVELFDRYDGPAIAPGKVGLAIRLVFQEADRTLASEEVSQQMDRIIQQLRDRLGAVLRGN